MIASQSISIDYVFDQFFLKSNMDDIRNLFLSQILTIFLVLKGKT